MLKHLGGIDSWTKAILRLPIPGKGGVSLKRCVAGVTAFTTDHVEVIVGLEASLLSCLSLSRLLLATHTNFQRVGE